MNIRAYKTITAHMLCMAIAWTTVVPVHAATGSPATVQGEQALLRASPNARVIHVTEEEYPRLAAELQRRGYRQAGNAQPLRLAAQERSVIDHQGEERDYPQQSSDRSCEEEAAAEPGGGSVHIDFNLTNSGGGGDEGAVVLYVIIGTVVVIVWTLYLFKFLYDLSMGHVPCRWTEVAFTTSAINYSRSQHANFTGLSFKAGVRDGATEFGLSAELGNADITLVENGTLNLNGLYWLIGPNLRWRFSSGSNPHYFEMQFMGGSTDSPQTGLLAKAELGLHLGVSERMNLGLSWGAININLRETQGIISERSQFHYLYGISAGYRF